jgi:hypothetical protein
MTIEYGMPSAAYHAHSALGSSSIRTLTSKTPAHYAYQRNRPAYSGAFDIGTAAHSVILEDTFAGIQEVEADNWMTKAAKEAKAAARAAGKTPLLAKELAQVRAMRDSVMNDPRARATLEGGTPEVSVFWDHETGTPLKCRPDKWTPDHADGQLIVDLKTTVSADPEDFAKSVGSFGYHQQEAHYVDGLKAHGFDPKFMFVLVEKTAPYLVNVVELDPYAVALGRAANEKAIRLYNECSKNNRWPGYQTTRPVSLPVWAERQAEELEFTF